MSREDITEDDMNRMRQQYLRDEFAGNKESLEQRKDAFKQQLQAARGGQLQQEKEQPAENKQPANDNRQQNRPNNAHNTGQGKETKPVVEKERARQAFKEQLQQARSGQQRQAEFSDNKASITGQNEAGKTSDFKVNAKDVTEKNQEQRDAVKKASPKPSPNPGFTRTWGPDRD